MSASEQSSPPDTSSEATEEEDIGSAAAQYSFLMNQFVRGVELAAATVFAVLFAIGLVDLTIQILVAVRSGQITDPLVVIGFIDTGLLLLIIVEVYQTVLAYVEENDTRRIVRLVIYTGVIAMVRKIIIFRTTEYDSPTDAMLVAGSYATIIFALVALLLAEQAYGSDLSMLSDD